MLCVIFILIFWIITPTTPTVFYHKLTIDTHGIDTYYLTIQSNTNEDTYTVVNENFSKILPHGEYHLEACYWNVNNTKKCEGQRIWLDEDLIVHFFVDVID